MSLPLRRNITCDEIKPRPFLKWAGGKRQLLTDIERLLPIPNTFRTYFEPFVGGGAVFFNFAFKKTVISDTNEELINAYKIIKKDIRELIHLLKKHKQYHSKSYFYNIRKTPVIKLTKIERTARLIYLNKTCYNGLYRVNSKGGFNVPFGSYTNPRICDEENLIAVHKKLKNVKIFHKDFMKISEKVEEGDFIYFDPPYEPISTSANFVNYVKNGFSSNDQVKLANLFKELTGKGVQCMLSNSSAPLIRKLYKDFNIHSVKASRHVNSLATGRGKIEELIITNY